MSPFNAISITTISDTPARNSVTMNVTGVPGSVVHCYATQQLAQAAYDEALDNGQVVQITHVVFKETHFC